jgi:PAS domain S-box-containing protein
MSGQLYESKEQNENLADSIISLLHEPFLILDKNYFIVKANDSFRQIFGLEEEKIVGKSFFELLGKSFDVESLQEAFETIHQKKKIEVEIASNARNILFKLKLYSSETEDLLLVALKETTSEKIENAKLIAQKEVEKNLRLILESIPQITITLSATGYVTFFNQFFLDYTGLLFDEAITAKGWKQILHPEEIEAVIKAGQYSLLTGKDFYKEIRLKRKSDDKYRWHIAKASAIKDENRRVKFWVGAATDIEEQKMKEQKKDEFISVASHEMKTPLTTAKAYLQLLEHSLTHEDEKSFLYAKKASAAVKRLNDLISELLDVSKIQFGKLNFNIENFDFNEMIDQAIENIQYSSPNHVIIKTGEVDKEVTGDKDRLQQVVINLLSNAVKYSPESDKVFIHIQNDDDEIKVSVTDYGIGISSQNIEKIFERYYRVEDNSIQFSGLGIGLFISNEIMQRHHGKLWAESEPGKGSTFYFIMPLHSSDLVKT